MDRALVSTSRFLSRVLRHRPEQIGLSLDAAGWAEIDALLRQANAHGVRLTRPLLERIVAGHDKQRFAIDASGRRIRASQGHSIDIDLGLPPAVPPERLFHGTATRFLHAIRRQGLRPGRRRHVHLSADADTARHVGLRHGLPTVLAVAAGRMHRDGHVFLCADNGVWLTAAVPARYLRFDADADADADGRGAARDADPGPTPPVVRPPG